MKLDEIQQIPELYRAGWRTGQIAEKFQVTKDTIKSWAKKLKAEGYDFPDSKKGRPSVFEKIKGGDDK